MAVESESTAPAIRSREILDRVRAVFSEKGFDGASMQDLARAASMSAGNFYRYFPSKSAIVEALVQRSLEDAEQDFERIRSSADPRNAVRETIRNRIHNDHCDQGPIWAEIQAAAFRRPEIAVLLERMESHICRNVVELFAQIRGVPIAVAHELYWPQARLIMLLVDGLMIMHLGNASPADHARREKVVELVIDLIEKTVDQLPDVSQGPAHSRKTG
jgi:AcrR family transcriptional regulator